MARAHALVGAVATAVALASPSWAAPCASAAIAVDAPPVPAGWRRELDALVASTAREGHPWSCTGAKITLAVEPEGAPATLTIEDAFGKRERVVEAPADLVPLGKALLAIAVVVQPPQEAPAMAVAPPVNPPPRARDDRSAPPTAEAQRLRLLVDGLAETRFSGPTRAIWAGAVLRGSALYDAWLGGLWARYEAPVVVLDHVPPDFSMSSVSIGLAGGRRLLTKPFELDATFEPSLAVVLTGAHEHEHPEETVEAKVDLRLGARLGAGIPVSRRFRVLVAIDGEFAPSALGGGDHWHWVHEHLPDRPAYMLGLSFGAEVSVP